MLLQDRNFRFVNTSINTHKHTQNSKRIPSNINTNSFIFYFEFQLKSFSIQQQQKCIYFFSNILLFCFFIRLQEIRFYFI